MNVQEALQKLPAEIRRVENELFDRKQEIEGLRHRLKMREADLARSIALATEQDGKKKFPNADARDAALRAALDDDQAAAGLRKQLIEVETLQQRVASTLTYFENLQRNARALCARPDPLGLIFAEA